MHRFYQHNNMLQGVCWTANLHPPTPSTMRMLIGTRPRCVYILTDDQTHSMLSITNWPLLFLIRHQLNSADWVVWLGCLLFDAMIQWTTFASWQPGQYTTCIVSSWLKSVSNIQHLFSTSPETENFLLGANPYQPLLLLPTD